MIHQDFRNIVMSVTKASLADFFCGSFHMLGSFAYTDDFPVILAMHKLDYSFDDIARIMSTSYHIEVAAGMIKNLACEEWRKPKAPYTLADIQESLHYKLNRMLHEDSQHADCVFSLIRQGGSGISLKRILDGFALRGYFRHHHDVNLCRDQYGALRPVSDLLLLPKTATIAKVLCESAMVAEDAEAVRYIAAIPEYKKFLGERFVPDNIKVVNNYLRSKQKRDTDLSIINEVSGYNLQDYANLLISYENYKQQKDSVTVDAIYDAEILRQAPDHFIELIMNHKEVSVGTANIFIARMARDGMPTKGGFLMANKGRFFVIQYPTAEMSETEIVELCFENKAKRGYLGILIGMSPEVVAAHKAGQKLLNLMYELSPSNEIAQCLDTKGRAKQFKNDLGV
jgi:hypothetical protein